MAPARRNFLMLLLLSAAAGPTAPGLATAQALPLSPTPAPSEQPSAAGTSWPKARTILDLETLWEVPEAPEAVLFVAHGCNHAGSDWWPPSPRCPHCLGLPEEMAIRVAALQRKLAVVAVSSYNRTSGCWHNTSPSKSEDVQRLPGILAAVREEEGLAKLPLYAFGASSGGGIVLRLAQVMPEVKGIIAQIVPARPELMVPQNSGSGGSSDEAAERSFPPTLFVHMAQRDPDWAQEIGEALEYCSQAGIPADEIRVDPRPVTPRLLQRSPLISRDAAEAAVAALHAVGLLDEEGFLLHNPRDEASSLQWQEALRPVLGSRLDEPQLASHVSQLLNVAYAQHEISSNSAALSFEWVQEGGRKSIRELRHREARREERQRWHAETADTLHGM